MAKGIEILNIVVWPLVVLIGAGLLTSERGSKALGRVLGPMRRVKALGVELEFGQEEGGRRIKATLEDQFREYRDEVESEFGRQSARFDVGRLLAIVVEQVIEELLEPKSRVRCTVYVPDIVFKGALYRLLDYYPGGNGAGRVYSERFGIIGRTWRLGRSQYERTVPADREILIKEWGMTKAEAATQAKKSFVAFLLRDEPHDPVAGLLYIECEDGGFTADPCNALEGDPSVQALTDAVSKVMLEMRGRGPFLELLQT